MSATFKPLADAAKTAAKEADQRRAERARLLAECEPLRVEANRALRLCTDNPDFANMTAYARAKGLVTFFEKEKIEPATEAMQAAFAAHDAVRAPYEAAKRLRDAAQVLRGFGLDPFTLLAEWQHDINITINGSAT